MKSKIPILSWVMMEKHSNGKAEACHTKIEIVFNRNMLPEECKELLIIFMNE